MSMSPRRSAPVSSRASGANTTLTPGASCRSRSRSGTASAVRKSSAACTMNVLCNFPGSNSAPGRRIWSARRKSPPSSSRIWTARGVGTSPCPARTNRASPVIRRSLPNERLTAGGEVAKRSAAAVTLFSCSSASRTRSRFKSIGAASLTFESSIAYQYLHFFAIMQRAGLSRKPYRPGGIMTSPSAREEPRGRYARRRQPDGAHRQLFRRCQR